MKRKVQRGRNRGVIGAPIRIQPGVTAGNLMVLKEEHRVAGRRHLLCRCVLCDSEKIFPSAGLSSRKSCGCIAPRPETPLTPRERLADEILYRCRRYATKRGHTCTLTRGQVQTLIHAECYYCGSPPASRSRTKTERKREKPGLRYNGIDRENAFSGYHFLNCRTCCERCNSAKMQMSASEYVAHCAAVVKHATTSPRNLFD